jgi:hypothetical protein
LGQRLGVFKWKNYWEISRCSVVIEPGGKSRQRMSSRREVEISLAPAQQMTISIYTDGKLTRRRTQPLDTPLCIAGGDKEEDQAWFIVVRRDNPPSGDSD